TKLIRDRKVDLVHARSRAPAWSALLSARRTGKPFVTTYHGAYGGGGPVQGLFKNGIGGGGRVIAQLRHTPAVVEGRRARAQARIPRLLHGADATRLVAP